MAKTKQKKILVIILAALMAMTIVSLATRNANSADAETKQTLFLDESFDSQELVEAKWSRNSDNIKFEKVDEAYAKVTQNCEEYSFGTKDKLSRMTKIQFDYKISATPSTSALWIGVYFLNGDYDFGNDAYNFDLCIQKLLNNQTSIIQGSSKRFTGNTVHSNETGCWFTVTLEPVYDEETKTYSDTKLKITLNKKGNTGPEQIQSETFNWSESLGYSFRDSRVVLATCGGSIYYLDNILIETEPAEKEVEVGGEKVESSNVICIGEDFQTEELSEGLKEYKRQSTTSSYSRAVRKGCMQESQSKKGDYMLYNEAVPEESSIIENTDVLDITFVVNMYAGKKDKLSLVLGVDESSDSCLSNCTACVFESDEAAEKGYVTIKNITDGVETVLTSEKIELSSSIYSSQGTTLRIVVNKDGTIKVYEGKESVYKGEAKEEKPNFYVGLFGFASTEEEENTGVVTIDSVVINQITYKVPTTKSVTHNFSNDYFGHVVSEEEEAKGLKSVVDFKLNTTGNKNGMYVKDGKLVWEGLSDGSYFEPNYEYDNFVLEFKLCAIDGDTTASGRWLGLDVGKASAAASLYGSNVLLAFEIVPQNSSSEYVSLWKYAEDKTRSAYDNIKIIQNAGHGIPVEYLKNLTYNSQTKPKDQIKASDALCIRYVAQGNTMYLYLKKASDLNYTLYYTIENIETTGYQALCCTGYTSLELDDFSMSNTSSNYICADNWAPDKEIVTKQKTIYDHNFPDTNGELEKTVNANASSGCFSGVLSGRTATWVLVPLMILALVMTIDKKLIGKKED